MFFLLFPYLKFISAFGFRSKSKDGEKLQDMMDVVETKPTKQYGDFFLRQIAKVCTNIHT